MDIWTPTIGETLQVKPEPSNEMDSNAVAVLKENGMSHAIWLQEWVIS